MTQAMKRRENRIVELEKLLEVANQRTHRNSEEKDLLFKQLGEAKTHVEQLTSDLKLIQKENEQLKMRVQSTQPTDLPVIKKNAWHSRNPDPHPMQEHSLSSIDLRLTFSGPIIRVLY